VVEINRLDMFEWASDAKYFLKILHSLQPHESVMVFLRHSQRTEPKVWEEVMKAPLTADGIEVASEFGANLPKDRSYHIYHSRIERCRQTAEAIQNGFLRNPQQYTDFSSNQIAIKGYLPVLTEFYMQPQKFQEYTERDGTNFVRNWLANHYSPDISESALSYAQRAAHDILSVHLQRPPNTTNLYISHDFNILVFRALWSGFFPDGDWISYLGGFLLKLDDQKMTIYFNQSKEEVYYPHWWQAISGLAF
jgi:broad specificity phosphatase PhoE